MDVTVVTYDKYPDLAPDDRIFREALVARGAGVRTAVWSDASVDWAASPVTVMRAAWDYPHRVAEFEAWLARVEGATTLINGARTVRWNMHKRYLAELERLGISITPTVFADRSSEVDLASVCRERRWDDVVLKPCIGGSSFGAVRLRGEEIAAAGEVHLRSLLTSGDAMIQPFVAEVERAGERAYIFIDGVFTHAVRKTPFNSSTETTSEERLVPPEAELRFARRSLDVLAERPAYARVDLVPTASGPVVMELELIEPTLYFELERDAAERLADVVMASV